MAPPPSRRYIGEVILRRYLVEELLGEGSFAWVYRARDRDGEQVAVKVLHSTHATASVRFAREVRVLQALPANPNVAHYVDHGHSRDGRPVLVIEFVDGITLKVGLERRPTLGPAQAVSFVAELCEAFAGLHQLGVAHRDVKPDNILLARTGGIKLIDFGLIRDAQGLLRLLEGEDPLETRVFQDELDKGVLAGTPEYMAPEQFSDSAVADISQARTDTWSDVFSLGVILYELLTGHKPFVMRDVPKKDYPKELIRYLRWRLRLRDSDIPRIPSIDSALQSIVHKALRRDPRQRQPDARALADDLIRYQQTGKGVQQADESRTMVASLSHVVSLHDVAAAAQAQSTAASTHSGPAYDLFDDGSHRRAPSPVSSSAAFARTVDASPAPSPVVPNASPAPDDTRDIRNPAPTSHLARRSPRDRQSADIRPPDPSRRPQSSHTSEHTRDVRPPREVGDRGPTTPSAALPTADIRAPAEASPPRPAFTRRNAHRPHESDALPLRDRRARGEADGLDEHPTPRARDRGCDRGRARLSRRDEVAPSASRTPQDQAVHPPQDPAVPVQEDLRTTVMPAYRRERLRQKSGDLVETSDRQDEAWVEENLADPPKKGEPAILRAPTDAPSLSVEDFFGDWEDDELEGGFFEESSEELNLADLAPRRSRRSR